MRFKERKEMETPTTMGIPEIKSNVQQQTSPVPQMTQNQPEAPQNQPEAQRFGSVSPNSVPVGSVNPYLGSWATGMP